jgi:hypothetical protein
MNSPFPWPGGKRALKTTLLSLLPAHEIYVEVFAGSAKLLFAKEPSRFEVMNDLDGGVPAQDRDEVGLAVPSVFDLSNKSIQPNTLCNCQPAWHRDDSGRGLGSQMDSIRRRRPRSVGESDDAR